LNDWPGVQAKFVGMAGKKESGPILANSGNGGVQVNTSLLSVVLHD